MKWAIKECSGLNRLPSIPLHPRRTAYSLQPTACRGGRAARGCRGFTLMEVLMVMVIIALLASIIVGSAQYVVKVSRTRRYEVTCQTLQTALARYRNEYNQWPLGGFKPAINEYTVTVTGDDNKKVFHMLREDNHADNNKGIRFLEETTLFTLDAKGTRMPLNKADASKQSPLVYVDRETGSNRYFTVRFDLDNETAKVY